MSHNLCRTVFLFRKIQTILSRPTKTWISPALSSFPTTYNPHVTHNSTDFPTYFGRRGPELTISLPNFHDSRNRKPIPEAFAEAVRHAWQNPLLAPRPGRHTKGTCPRHLPNEMYYKIIDLTWVTCTGLWYSISVYDIRPEWIERILAGSSHSRRISWRTWKYREVPLQPQTTPVQTYAFSNFNPHWNFQKVRDLDANGPNCHPTEISTHPEVHPSLLTAAFPRPNSSLVAEHFGYSKHCELPPKSTQTGE